MEKVCVVGLGYIGLPTAAVLAGKGFSVRGVDCSPPVVAALNKGETLICEPALDVLVKAAVQGGQLQAGLTPDKADTYIIAVPTPFRAEHQPDLSFVESAVKSIIPYLQAGNLIILESTCPVGTTEKIASQIKAERPDLCLPGTNEPAGAAGEQIFIAHCPERVLPGNIINEIVSNDRIVGGLDQVSAQKAVDFYRRFIRGKVFAADARTAELTKLAENSFRDVNIAFANELSLICDKLNINVWELIELANRHPRVNILQPGPGVGGHCIAVDPWFIVSAAPEEARLIHAARQVNDHKPLYVVNKIREKARRFENPRIACLGLAFKANVDDLRESPAVAIVEQLAQTGDMVIMAVEPYIKTLPPQLARYKNIKQAAMEEAVEQADIVVLLVEHRQFGEIEKSTLREKVVVDTRGLWR